MKKFVPIFAAASLMLGTAAIAAEPAPAADPAAPAAPAERMAPSDTEATPPAATPPADSTAAPTAPTDTTAAAADTMTLTDEEAEKWVGKTVYSSDDQNVGEVAAIERDPSGKVKEIHADIGGFLGLGETRVRVMPSEFKLVNDRVMLNVNGEQSKELPKVEAAK